MRRPINRLRKQVSASYLSGVRMLNSQLHAARVFSRVSIFFPIVIRINIWWSFGSFGYFFYFALCCSVWTFCLCGLFMAFSDERCWCELVCTFIVSIPNWVIVERANSSYQTVFEKPKAKLPFMLFSIRKLYNLLAGNYAFSSCNYSV